MKAHQNQAGDPAKLGKDLGRRAAMESPPRQAGSDVVQRATADLRALRAEVDVHRDLSAFDGRELLRR